MWLGGPEPQLPTRLTPAAAFPASSLRLWATPQFVRLLTLMPAQAQALPALAGSGLGSQGWACIGRLWMRETPACWNTGTATPGRQPSRMSAWNAKKTTLMCALGAWTTPCRAAPSCAIATATTTPPLWAGCSSRMCRSALRRAG